MRKTYKGDILKDNPFSMDLEGHLLDNREEKNSPSHHVGNVHPDGKWELFFRVGQSDSMEKAYESASAAAILNIGT